MPATPSDDWCLWMRGAAGIAQFFFVALLPYPIASRLAAVGPVEEGRVQDLDRAMPKGRTSSYLLGFSFLFDRSHSGRDRLIGHFLTTLATWKVDPARHRVRASR